jgi:hypothetical protein
MGFILGFQHHCVNAKLIPVREKPNGSSVQVIHDAIQPTRNWKEIQSGKLNWLTYGDATAGNKGCWDASYNACHIAFFRRDRNRAKVVFGSEENSTCTNKFSIGTVETL